MTALKKVQIQPNRSLKILYNKDYITPTLTLHTELDLLLVQEKYKINIAKFVIKQRNQLLPDLFNNLFIEYSHAHSHNTKGQLAKTKN